MTYTKKHLREVEDSALRYGLSDTQEARFARRDLAAEEIYVVLAGSGRVKLDHEVVDLIELDALRVGPGTARMFEAGLDGLELLIFGTHVDGDVEQVSGFWSS